MEMDCFLPSKEWNDTDGNLIQAHAGYIFYENSTYYWYGENKEKSITEREIWHWGVRLYSSKDLYNWKSEGIILPPELSDKTNPLYFNSRMDRPHIVYNEKTKKYVMWIKIMESKMSSKNYACIAVSDSIKGPFVIIKEKYQPNGFEFGDFDIVKEKDKAFLIYNKPHTELIITQLNDDFMSVKDENIFKSYFHNKYPPYIREAPCLFKRDEKWYMITSGTTGKFPNRSEVAVADSIMGEWKVLCDPFIDDFKHTSFHSQVSCVFKHPLKKDLYIVVADRWLIDLKDDMPDVNKIYESMFNREMQTIPFDETKWTSRNTLNARYVWLPLIFKDGKPEIRWYDKWQIDKYN